MKAPGFPQTDIYYSHNELRSPVAKDSDSCLISNCDLIISTAIKSVTSLALGIEMGRNRSINPSSRNSSMPSFPLSLAKFNGPFWHSTLKPLMC